MGYLDFRKTDRKYLNSKQILYINTNVVVNGVKGVTGRPFQVLAVRYL